MKTKLLSVLTGGILLFLFSCKNVQDTDQTRFVEENVTFAAQQYGLHVKRIEESGEILNPRTYIDGEIRYVKPQSWTSGFFPGSIW